MNLRQKITILATALLLGLGLLTTLLGPETPVVEAGQWCGRSCSKPLPPTPTP
jgi:hypothetical protein